MSDDFTLRGTFHGALGRVLAKYLKKAADMTEVNDIFVLDHLKDVVKSKDFSKIDRLMSSHWRGHHGARLNAGLGPIPEEDYVKDGLKFNSWFAVLVAEKSHEEKALKVLYVPLSFFKDGVLPHPEDMLVEVGIDENGVSKFEYAPDHPDAARLKTNKTIVEKINSNPEYWRSHWLIKEILAPKAKVVSAPSMNHTIHAH